MLSHLRFHRRGPSNPTSPLPDQTFESAAIHEHPLTTDDVSPRPDMRPRSANASQMPPTLPPIPRVTSTGSDLSFSLPGDSQLVPPRPSRSPPMPTSFGDVSSGFIGGVALQNYRRGGQGQPRQETSERNSVPDDAAEPPPPPPQQQQHQFLPPINTGQSSPKPPALPPKSPRQISSFVPPTERQQFSGQPTGKRPAGARIVSEPVSLATLNPPPEAQKGRKGLPFLKNPMSTLLMRRRTAQNALEIEPLPLRTQADQPLYDPRIRGTRIHDFSAPRQKKVTPLDNGNVVASAAQLDVLRDGERRPVLPELTSLPIARRPRGGSDGQRSVTAESLREGHPEFDPSRSLHHNAERPQTAQPDTRRISLDKPLPHKPAAPAVTTNENDSPLYGSSRSTSRTVSRRSASTLLGSDPSTRSNRSQLIKGSDLSKKNSTASAIPKHMTSTSSRFSFDMIGAAKQEKLLEERHRQRELEKGPADAPGQRDSRFDDLDADGFDYDAMMEDDGLEERIPGVNADDEDDYELDEEIMDPDNDQHNFAGFVFQRSNPPSSLTSPHTPGMLATPRDAEGKAIGFAMTKDTTPELPGASSPDFLGDPAINLKADDSVGGLGIHGLNLGSQVVFDQHHVPQPYSVDLPKPAPVHQDELYFDDGLAEELEFEHDGSVFDESIFDNNDTDQYGRPIPGAFAQAKSARAAERDAAKRESDSTARLSEQSAESRSTAHTSISTDLQPAVNAMDGRAQSKDDGDHVDTIKSVRGREMDYQAALAEAAHAAVASGKFRRGSSPAPPTHLTVTSPTDSSSHSQAENGLDSYEDDPLAQDLEDFDFDDEAIIAEANASALANDMDDFYGQEFGFYSAPASQGNGPSITAAKPLSAENLMQYGGYFGQRGGLVRSKSGNILSREPNLTPITERSEYSNRNSIMSLALPPGFASGGSGSGPLHSPGLVQLAMMADDDDNMSLQHLMRLRSKAWGGSQASLVSSREGSPRSERGDGPANTGPGMGPGAQLGHARKNSAAYSIWSNSDAGSVVSGGSPTTTMSMPFPLPSSPNSLPPLSSPVAGHGTGGMVPMPMFSPPPPPVQQAHQHHSPSASMTGGFFPPVLEDEESTAHASPATSASRSGSATWMRSPVDDMSSPPAARRPSMGHRRGKGSADSISYTMEPAAEQGGEARWVMERRRTYGESGEVEILEREVLEGGRI